MTCFGREANKETHNDNDPKPTNESLKFMCCRGVKLSSDSHNQLEPLLSAQETTRIAQTFSL